MSTKRYANKKIVVIAFFMSIFACLVAASQSNQTQGEDYFQQALILEKQRSFTEAFELYEQALPLLLEEDNSYLANASNEALQRLTLFFYSYPYTQEDIQDMIRDTYPQLSKEQIKALFVTNELEYYIWDGQKHYFESAVDNLKYRNLDLIRENPKMNQTYFDLVTTIVEKAKKAPETAWMPYQNPATYHGTGTISVPRSELPDEGTYRIWIPLPINSGSQSSVTIESVTPVKWVKYPPSIGEDIGLLYMEIPTEDLTEDLFIQVAFTFTHYEQRFTIDPDNIGEYDKDSPLYQQYTRSYGNTKITSDIRQMAKTIVGDETNPYRAARAIYDYIVYNVDYGFMPHSIFLVWPWTSQSETDYTHRYQRGDCGAQSMYFSAMCRSLGIPARATGGFQLFNKQIGTHFWAEIYLPNYGWIPVDTSYGQLGLFPKGLTDEQRKTFIDFCFGNLDNMRFIVQKDVDVPLIPTANSSDMLSMAVQFPIVEYSIPTGEIPALTILEGWSIDCKRIND